ncbi:MAG: hypothetical protein SFW67_26370 [Myxococcaceae bacterium]|nr:hypothetical protein [Myxococcaceae bacterium]
MIRTLACLLAVSALLLTTGCPTTPTCTPQSCASGCCSASGVCESGDTAMACGTAGARCDTSISSQVCSAGRCMAVSGVGGGAAGGTGGGSAGGAGGGATSDTITGTYQAVFGWDGDGGRTSSIDFSRATVGVWYRDGGSPDFIRGAGTAQGTFSVANLPPGEVTLQLGDRYIVTSDRSVAFNFAVGGRIDAQQATQASLARFTFDGLEPLNDTHSIGIFFTQGDSAAFNLETVARPPTMNGATQFASDLDWLAVSQGVDVGLPDSSKGDLGWAFQNQSIVTDAGVTTMVVRAGAIAPFTLTNGGIADVAATALTAPPTATWAIAVDRAAFEAVRASVGRDVGAGQWSFEVGTSPAAEARNNIHSAFTLGSVVVNEPAAPPSSLAFATPFPATWARTAEVSYFVRQPRTPPNGMPIQFAGGVVSVMPLAMAMGGTIALPISPVRGAQIASRNFTEDQTGIGLTPSLSWMAPTTGTVTSYRVSIFRMGTNGQNAQLQRIYTKNPGVTLPPGLLTMGQSYVMQIEAMRWTEGPVYFGLPFSYSIVVSGVLTP